MRGALAPNVFLVRPEQLFPCVGLSMFEIFGVLAAIECEVTGEAQQSVVFEHAVAFRYSVLPVTAIPEFWALIADRPPQRLPAVAAPRFFTPYQGDFDRARR